MNKLEYLQELNPDAILVQELEEALVGVIERNSVFVALYDIEKSIELLMKKFNLPQDEATDHLYVNIIQAYLGDNTPKFATMFSTIFSE